MSDETASSRPTAQLIYARVLEDAEDELSRPARSLAFSGLFAGFTIGATPLAVAVALMLLDGDSSARFVASLLYPIGFVAVIVGRAQLFTENTLYPAAASFADRSHLPGTARLWAIVLATNLVGGIVFALLVIESKAIPADATSAFSALGEKAAAKAWWATFWSGVLAGWLLALVAWLVEASESAIGQVLVIVLLTLPIGLTPLDHSVATAVEVAGAVFGAAIGVGEALGWFAATVLGNILGGVFIVALLNYGQVRSETSA